MFLQSVLALLMHIQHCSSIFLCTSNKPWPPPWTFEPETSTLSQIRYLHIVSVALRSRHGVHDHASLLCAVTVSETVFKLSGSFVCLSVTCVTQNDFVILPRQWLCVWCVFQLWVKPVALSSPWWLCCQSDIKEAYFSQQYAWVCLHLTEIHLCDVCPPPPQAHVLYFKPRLDIAWFYRAMTICAQTTTPYATQGVGKI